MPAPPPIHVRQRYPLDNLISAGRDVLGFFARLRRLGGDVAGCSITRFRVVLLSHPEAIGEVLVTRQRNFVKSRGLELSRTLLGEGLLTAEGDVHRRHRRLIQPVFHRRVIEGYGAAMSRWAERVGDGWRPGAEVDVHREMGRLALGVVGEALFSTEVEGDAAAIGAALDVAVEQFRRVRLPFARQIERLPLPSNRRFRRAVATLDSAVGRLVAGRREAAGDDLVSRLLAARDAGDAGDGGGGLDDREVRDEALTLLLAGHETTAVALSWTWYLLSQNPDAEAALHAELDRELAGRAATAADLERLPVTRATFLESMRLYPPAWTVGRRALEDCEIAGHRIPARAGVYMCQYLVHRDPRFFPRPEVFDPGRWLDPQAVAALPRFAYFPFGGGARRCIGDGFAELEGVLALATLAARWRLRLVPGHPVAMEPLITLRPRYGIRMTLEQR
jgi:cytochrome P450